MNLVTLSLRNLERRKVRTALTMLGVAIAAASLFAMLSFNRGFEQAMIQEMSDSGIHLFVSTEGCPMEAASLALHGGEIPKFLSANSLPLIKDTVGVKEAAGLLIFSQASSNGKGTDLFYGIGEAMRKLKPHWKIRGSWFTSSDSIILGAEAAKVEKREVGDKIYFQNIDHEFVVSGIIERTGSEDDGFFYLPLETAQKIFHKEGKLTGVAVSLSNVEKIADVKDRLETIPDIYVVTSQQMMDQIGKLVSSSKTLMFAVLAIALVISLLGVLNTILMTVFEMTREFGYLRCVGASRSAIVKLVLMETGLLCLGGAAFGVAAGAALSSGIDNLIRHVLPYAPSGQMVAPHASIMAMTVAMAVAAGLVAGIIPAMRASFISPKQAVRYE
ncbi:ABC transporter permease [Massilia putida]|uniref:ABC transporter permease n=1 Tax=Massilia putida TaxID=1141883 RepID=UPI0009510DE8|nr:ABC transporter permease [Massilia putida]